MTNSLLTSLSAATAARLVATAGCTGITDALASAFQQTHDFTNADVLHAQVEHLQWRYGSVYTRHVTHYFILHNFNVNSQDLKRQHKTALKQFATKIVTREEAIARLDNGPKTQNRYQGVFDSFEHPYLANARALPPKATHPLRETLIEQSDWARLQRGAEDPAIDDAQIARAQIRDKVLKATWWKADDICWPTYTDKTARTKTLEAALSKEISDTREEEYPAFLLATMMFWRRSTEASFSEFFGRASSTGTKPINEAVSKARAQSVLTEITTLMGAPLPNYVASEGSSAPLLPVLPNAAPSEIDLERSVQFSYTFSHDYLHVTGLEATTKHFHDQVQEIATRSSDLITDLEHHVTNPKTAADLRQLTARADLIRSLHSSAHYNLLVGTSATTYASEYGGDFRTIDHAFSGWGQMDKPAMETNAHYPDFWADRVQVNLPMYVLITRGDVHEKTFKKPLPYARRLQYAAAAYASIIDSVGKTYEVNTIPVTNQIKLNDFDRFYTASVNDLTLSAYHSFALKRYNDAQRNAMLNEQLPFAYELTVDINGENPIYEAYTGFNASNGIVSLPVSHFGASLTKNLVHFYGHWLDSKILKEVHAGQTVLAKPFFMLSILSVEVPEIVWLKILPGSPVTAIFNSLETIIFQFPWIFPPN